ncbi:hypothetical protein [Pseudoalteromonas aurantia]|uniref:Lipoprotein n=1 Tax=Pseudoalteromonas aurantia 208 TaxID=1314867 RepID=A0ABR9EI45_9GAMM|nr:hypothetical protein [Pseudoalteromonas aurantia]MBE0370664.1 hypothetical protein [Pseudoalteromonas aurantia 208]
MIKIIKLMILTLCLGITGCKPNHIAQLETQLQNAQVNRDLNGQYKVLSELVNYDSDEWKIHLANIQGSIEQLNNTNQLLAAGQIIEAQQAAHQAKLSNNSIQVDETLKKLQTYAQVSHLIEAVQSYNTYMRVSPLKTFLSTNASHWKILALNELYKSLITHGDTISQVLSQLPKNSRQDPIIKELITACQNQVDQLQVTLDLLLTKQLADFSTASVPQLNELYTTTIYNLNLFSPVVVIPMMKPMIRHTKHTLAYWDESLNNSRITLSRLNSPLASRVIEIRDAYLQLISQESEYANYHGASKKSIQIIQSLARSKERAPVTHLAPIHISANILSFSQQLQMYRYLSR